MSEQEPDGTPLEGGDADDGLSEYEREREEARLRVVVASAERKLHGRRPPRRRTARDWDPHAWRS